MMLACRRTSSSTLYNSYLSKWSDFCVCNGLDPVYANIHDGIRFLHFLFCDENVSRGASAMGTAQSALS